MARTTSLRRRRLTGGYLLLVPAMLTVAAVIAYPLGVAVLTSLKAYELGEVPHFTGLANFDRMVHEPAFWSSVWITIRYAAAVVICTYLLGLAVALLLNRRFRGRAVVRSLAALPWAIPGVATALVWSFIFDPTFGIANQALGAVGIGPVPWLTSTDWALFSVTLVTIWQSLPFMAMMLLAGLQTIPRDLYEAASVDGASAWRSFRHITVPGLRGITPIAVVLVAMATLREFALIYVLTKGGPVRSTETLGVQIYQEAFHHLDFGYASAIGVASLMLSLVFAIGYIRLTRREFH